MKTNILITGSTGFVGQNLVRYLESESMFLFLPSRKDIAQEDFVIPPTCGAVVHLAGKAHDLRRNTNADDYKMANYDLTKNVYDAFLESNANTFVFISSVKAVADSLNNQMTELTVPNPKTDYGKTKLLAEEYIRSCDLPTNKRFFILRPCMIHGPGNKGNLNLLYSLVKKGLPYPLGSFENRRSFLGVDNLCFIIHKLIISSIPSDTFNIADDQSLSTTQLIAILANSLNRKSRSLKVPKNLVKILAKIGDLFNFPFNSERLTKLTESYIVDNSKIKLLLDINLPFTTEQSLERTAKSFNNQQA